MISGLYKTRDNKGIDWNFKIKKLLMIGDKVKEEYKRLNSI